MLHHYRTPKASMISTTTIITAVARVAQAVSTESSLRNLVWAQLRRSSKSHRKHPVRVTRTKLLRKLDRLLPHLLLIYNDKDLQRAGLNNSLIL